MTATRTCLSPPATPHHLFVQESVIARNDGKGKFIDMADVSGDYFKKKFVSRGAAFADFSNNGNIDILVNTVNGPPTCSATTAAASRTGSRSCPCAKTPA